jgi:hypothetical protein
MDMNSPLYYLNRTVRNNISGQPQEDLTLPSYQMESWQAFCKEDTCTYFYDSNRINFPVRNLYEQA